MVNKRRKSDGCYLNLDEVASIIDEAYPIALQRAALETFEGQYDEIALGQKVNEAEIKAEAMRMIGNDL